MTTIDEKLQILRDVARDFMNRDGLRQQRVLDLIEELDEQIAREIDEASPTPAVQAEAVPQIKPRLLNQLRRFNECCDDSGAGGHDVDREDMHSLAELGAVRPAPGGRHYMTDFGHYLLAAPSTGDQS